MGNMLIYSPLGGRGRSDFVSGEVDKKCEGVKKMLKLRNWLILKEFTVNADRKAHEHEVFALELRMILK